MILYMTRMSYFDTANDFDLQTTAQMYRESRAILRSLMYTDETVLAPGHPTIKMWEGYEVSLAAYTQIMQIRLNQFGVVKGLSSSPVVRDIDDWYREGGEYTRPEWLDDTDILQAYRSNMIRRWPDRYPENTWRTTPSRMPYLWPLAGELLVTKDDKERLASGERVLPKKIQERVVNL